MLRTLLLSALFGAAAPTTTIPHAALGNEQVAVFSGGCSGEFRPCFSTSKA